MHRKKIDIPIVLAGQKLGIKEVYDGIGLVGFMHHDLGYIDLEQRTFLKVATPAVTQQCRWFNNLACPAGPNLHYETKSVFYNCPALWLTAMEPRMRQLSNLCFSEAGLSAWERHPLACLHTLVYCSFVRPTALDLFQMFYRVMQSQISSKEATRFHVLVTEK